MKAILLLEDGRVFPGLGHGFEGEAVGEVVFNTSMSGYPHGSLLRRPDRHDDLSPDW
jgi:carbamoylphosphate synthase small subunit